MFKVYRLLICYLSYFVLQSSAGDVDLSFIKPCKVDDKACIKSSVQAAFPYFVAGIPGLRLKNMDPLFIPETIHAGGSNLNLTCKNIKIIGINKIKIINFELDAVKQTIKFSVETPISLNGQYDLHGKLFNFETVGNGDFEAHSNKIFCNYDMKYEIIDKDGNKHWKITTVNYNYEILEKLHIKLHNLFGGDKTLAEPINNLLNENWKDVIDEFAGPIIDKIALEFINLMKKVFLVVPINKFVI